MHHKANGARSRRSTHAQDIRDQAVVLTFVLTLNPKHLTIPDLARSLNGESNGFKRPDAVERAVRDLTGVGLVEIGSGRVPAHGGSAPLHRGHRKRGVGVLNKLATALDIAPSESSAGESRVG